MPRILNDNVWVDGVMYPANSSPPGDVAARIGAHAWREAGPVAVPEVSAPEPVQSFGVEEVGPSIFAASEPAEDPAEVAGSGPAPAPSIPVPPKGGPGSGKSVWADYARAHNVSVEPGSSRDDIIDQLDDAGIPTE